MSRFFVAVFFAAIAFAATGCRNHLQDVDVSSTDYERNVVKDVVLVEVVERDVAEGMIKLKLTNHKVTEVKVFEVHNTISRFTPYQWWREFYELPLGLVVFPVGICSHIINVFSFGIFPYDWCWYMDCLGLTSLNPCLNIESSTRFDEEPLVSRRDEVDTRQESVSLLKGAASVTLRAGEGKVTVSTNPQGIATFYLLDVNGNGPTLVDQSRDVKIFVGASPTAAEEWIVSRELQGRLNRAAAAIAAYRGKPSGAALGECVKKLDELKFVRLAYILEQEELRRNAGVDGFATGFAAAAGE